MRRFSHFAAIDWSGAVGPRQKGIALALCSDGRDAPALIHTGETWSRAGIVAWLREALPPDSLVGLDLGPSLPFADAGAFFPGWDASPTDGRALWQLVEDICAGDAHLAASAFVDHPEASRYFRRSFGRKGDRFGEGRGRLRETERAQQAQGLNPYSNFNLVGAAQVGKSSLTGMRVLHRIQDVLPIWPFDPVPAAGSLVVEIYTSIAALAGGRPKGRTKMFTIEALNAALLSPAIASAPVAGSGPIDDHSADAILTAAWLRRHAHRPELWAPAGLEAVAHTEGWTFGVA